MPVVGAKNMGIVSDLSMGMGIGQGDVLAQQMKDETEELKRRNQQQATLNKVQPLTGVAADLGTGIGGPQG